MSPTPAFWNLEQPGLYWKSGLVPPTPKWTKEPSLDIIRRVSRQHLPVSEEQAIDITFLSAGVTNKLYTVSWEGQPKSYVFRVSLPVEPFYKTESEVATMRYVRYSTTIPVPRILAYNSSTENELGFEWILMDKLPGCTLLEVWREWGQEEKASVVREVAGYVAQLREKLRFASEGNLYYRRAMEKAAKEDIDIRYESVGEFSHVVIGPIVAPFFFTGRRARMQRNRGPFHSDHEYMMAQMQVQVDDMEFLLKCRAASAGEGDEEVNSIIEFDEGLAADVPEILEACSSLNSLLPYIFPPEPPVTEAVFHNGPNRTGEISVDFDHQYILHHADLSLTNIMVDPDRFRITGLVDWESVNIHPRWEEKTYPQFLTGPVVEEKPPPLSEEAKDKDKKMQEHLDNWEKTVLRQVFDEELGWIYRRTSFQDSTQDEEWAKRKREFKEHLEQVEFSPEAVKKWADEMRERMEKERADT